MGFTLDDDNDGDDGGIAETTVSGSFSGIATTDCDDDDEDDDEDDDDDDDEHDNLCRVNGVPDLRQYRVRSPKEGSVRKEKTHKETKR